MRVEDGGPAFPVPPPVIPNERGGFVMLDEYGLGPQAGMSLRDYFAGQALAGVLSGDDSTLDTAAKICGLTVREYAEQGYPFWKFAAIVAYMAADAMLAARAMEPEAATPVLGGSVTVEPISDDPNDHL